MTPVMQTKFGLDGNCLAACIASLLEIDIDSIPNSKHDDWHKELNEWLITNHDCYMVSIHNNGYKPPCIEMAYVMAAGKTDRGTMHAVIVKGNKIVHDPLENSGVTFDKIEFLDLLVRAFK